MKIKNSLMTTCAVAMAVMVGGIGLSSASAAVTQQTITYTSAAPTGPTYGSSYTVAATASSGLPVTFTVDATSTNICSIAGAKVTFTGIGACTIDANQPGNATYAPAPQVQQTATDGPASQTIMFTTTAPLGQVSGGASYLVAASSPSGLPITFTVASGSTAVCTVTGPTPGGTAGSTGTVSGATINFIGAGTCTVLADQPGNSFYQKATQAQQSIPVAIGLQAIAFGFTVPASPKIGGSYQVRANTASGLTVSLAVAPASHGVCALSGVGTSAGTAIGTVKFTGAGTCAITGTQAGNNQFAAAPVATQSFKIAKAQGSVTATSKRKSLKLVVSGKLKLPKGITAAKGYAGKVTVTATKGGKTTSTGSGKLGKSGQYSVTLSRATAATSVTVKFGGNTVLVASTKKLSLA